MFTRMELIGAHVLLRCPEFDFHFRLAKVAAEGEGYEVAWVDSDSDGASDEDDDIMSISSAASFAVAGFSDEVTIDISAAALRVGRIVYLMVMDKRVRAPNREPLKWSPSKNCKALLLDFSDEQPTVPLYCLPHVFDIDKQFSGRWTDGVVHASLPSSLRKRDLLMVRYPTHKPDGSHEYPCADDHDKHDYTLSGVVYEFVFVHSIEEFDDDAFEVDIGEFKDGKYALYASGAFSFKCDGLTAGDCTNHNERRRVQLRARDYVDPSAAAYAAQDTTEAERLRWFKLDLQLPASSAEEDEESPLWMSSQQLQPVLVVTGVDVDAVHTQELSQELSQYCSAPEADVSWEHEDNELSIADWAIQQSLTDMALDQSSATSHQLRLAGVMANNLRRKEHSINLEYNLGVENEYNFALKASVTGVHISRCPHA